MRTPYFLIDEKKLVQNLEILHGVAERAGCKILLAQKAYSVWQTYPLIARYLAGTEASGLFEAKLGREEFGKEVHVFAPAYREKDIRQLVKIADHIVFNTPAQVRRFAPLCMEKGVSAGLRVNPECSTQEGHEIYDPCAPFSRLGTTLANFDEEILPLLDGLHFHTLCEQNADALAATVSAFMQKFGKYAKGMQWLNLGGGHHITRDDYDRELLIRTVKELREETGAQIYLEPGEAVVLNAGTLHARVLEVMKNGMDIAVLDVSAACHMPDVLEMPYRPPLFGSGKAGEKAHTYRLGGPTCLAGDVIGDYSFDEPLAEGDELVFGDMALYTMVKTNTFNGMPLPGIYLKKPDGKIVPLKKFGYKDFKGRL